jgi:hypothetical protein
MLAVLGLILLAAKPVPAQAQFDRSRIIGGPTFDAPRPEGLYVWLEDGALHLVFQALPGKKDRTYKVQLDPKGPITREKQAHFSFQPGGSGALYVTATLPKGSTKVEGTIKTQADLVVTDVEGPQGRIPVFLGPLAEPGAPTLTIGTFTPYRAPPPP